MKLHETQAIVARDKSKYRVVCCGRQWGKTTLSIWEMIGCAYYNSNTRIGYFAPTFTQARDIAWAMMKQVSQPLWSKPPNETRLELFIKCKNGGESEIILRGFESIESARGQQFDLLVLDEVAKMRGFEEGWQAILLATLLFRKGKALFISTPYGFNHFHKLFELGQSDNGQYKSWKFSSYANPFLSNEDLESIKKITTDDYFSQEYLADFRRFTGLIYREFDVALDVHEFEHEYDKHGDYYFGLDTAVRGWTAMLCSYVAPNGQIYHLDEYKKESLTAKQHADNIKEILKKYASLDKWTGYADPSAFSVTQQRFDRQTEKEMLWSLADEYLEEGLPIVRANNEVTPGINYVRQLHQQRRIHAHPRCVKYVEEKLQYQWRDQPETQRGFKDDPEEVRKINDHIMDCERYECYSKPQAPDELEEKRTTTFPAAFPPPKIDKPDENADQFEEIEIPSIYD